MPIIGTTNTGLFIQSSMVLAFLLFALVKGCIVIDEASKYALKEKKMYKYKSWMFFVFRYCQDTSGDPYKKEHKKIDKTNMEHISILSFWLQILCILIFIAVIVTMGILSVTINTLNYRWLIQIVLGSDLVATILLNVYAYIYMYITEGNAIKRFKAKEKRQEAVLMQQIWRKDVPAPSGEVSSLDDSTSTTASNSDNYNPYL